MLQPAYTLRTEQWRSEKEHCHMRRTTTDRWVKGKTTDNILKNSQTQAKNKLNNKYERRSDTNGKTSKRINTYTGGIWKDKQQVERVYNTDHNHCTSQQQTDTIHQCDWCTACQYVAELVRGAEQWQRNRIQKRRNQTMRKDAVVNGELGVHKHYDSHRHRDIMNTNSADYLRHVVLNKPNTTCAELKSAGCLTYSCALFVCLCRNKRGRMHNGSKRE